MKALLLSYHDDEEVKNIHPAQLALDQGHQILDNNGDINHVKCYRWLKVRLR